MDHAEWVESNNRAINRQMAKRREAIKAYMFMEQTAGGRNPHRPGTNTHHAFELGRAAIAKAEGR
jgi:hypothetical protein